MKKVREDKYKYLIIGGGVAGTTAAETIRKNDEEGSIAIVSDEPYNFYSRIMLSKPNFFLGVVPLDSVWLRRDEWYAKNKIDLLCAKEATRLDPKAKKVALADGGSVEYERLLLSVGGRARRLDVPGSDKQGIYYLRNLDDAKAIMETLDKGKKALVVGGGFIGFEMCELMRLAGKEVTFAVREEHYWRPLLDHVAGNMIESTLKKEGINLMLQAEVAEFQGQDKVERAILKDGRKIDCDTVIVGIGAVMGNDWVKETGTSFSRCIQTDEKMRTDLPDVWAAGDCIEYLDLTLGERVSIGNWVNAQEQGRVAGLNMTGKDTTFNFVSFYTTQGFGITIAFCADNDERGESKSSISRGTGESGQYGRLIVKEGRLVGATLINKTAELGTIRQLIQKQINIEGREQDFANPEFDLKSLLPKSSP